MSIKYLTDEAMDWIRCELQESMEAGFTPVKVLIPKQRFQSLAGKVLVETADVDDIVVVAEKDKTTNVPLGNKIFRARAYKDMDGSLKSSNIWYKSKEDFYENCGTFFEVINWEELEI